MLRRGTGWALVALALALALALGGCGGGDDDGGDSSAPPKEPVARCTPGKAGAKSVAIKPKWKIGDRRTIDIQKSREDTELDEPIHVSGTAQLQVIDTGRKGSSLRWQSGPESLPASVLLLEETKGDEFRDKVDPLRIEYATDSDGAIEAVGNLSALRTQVSAMLDALAEVTGKESEVENMRRVAESDAFLQTAMVEDPAILHNVYGVVAERGETVRGPYELPNPFGGKPIPSTASYTLTTPRDRNGCAVLSVTVDADSDAIAEILADGIGQLAPGQAPDESDFENMTLRHEMSFSYDPGSGWIARADVRKKVTLDERKRTDRTLMVTR